MPLPENIHYIEPTPFINNLADIHPITMVVELVGEV